VLVCMGCLHTLHHLDLVLVLVCVVIVVMGVDSAQEPPVN